MPVKVRSKVRSGCQTCKARKVKCDEAWPICHRCQSTGRCCAGYGVWGGGGRPIQIQHESINGCAAVLDFIDISNHTQVQLTKPVPLMRLDMNEQQCFDWFIARSMVKLPGAFVSEWLAAKLLQASVTEPSIRHALLALSSAHRTEVQDTSSTLINSIHNDAQVLFTVKQYSLAINNLQPCFHNSSRASIHILLITCVLFISMEFLQGNYTKGVLHIKHGLSLLQQSWSRIKGQDSFSKFIDGWLLISFMRFLVQAKLLGQLSEYPADGFLTPYLNPNFELFTSSHHARRSLESTTLRVFDLQDQCQQLGEFITDQDMAHLTREQQMAQADLKTWLKAYEATISNPVSSTLDYMEVIAYRLLRLYYCITVILTETCLEPANEMRFDRCEPTFLTIISQCIDIYKSIFLPQEVDARAQLHIHESESSSGQSVSDIGWIAPLYFTAIHCRNHRIRNQAVLLLKLTDHKEGIWDAGLAAATALRVIELEERSFYSDLQRFDMLAIPTMEELARPTLPSQFRLSRSMITLPESKHGKLSIGATRVRSTGVTESVRQEYDLRSRTWTRTIP